MRCANSKHTYERSQDLVTEIVRNDFKIIANNREVIIETSNGHIEVPLTVCEDLIESLSTLWPLPEPCEQIVNA
jgi:hypothetical protein